MSEQTFGDDLEVKRAPASHETGQEHAISPHELFGRHVEYVRQYGDAVDLTSDLEKFKKSQLSYVMGAAALSHVVLLSKGTLMSPSGILFGGSAVWLLSTYLRSSRQKDITNKLNKTQDCAAQSALHEYYELWRVQNDTSDKNDVVMHWQGTFNNEELGDDLPSRALPRSVNLVAKLANENDIKAVMVAPESLAQVPNAAAFATTQVDLIDWASRKKQTDFIVTDDDAVSKHQTLVFTPEQFTLLAKHIEKTHVLPPDIAGYIDVLREYNAEHPLVKTHDTFADTPELLPAKLQSVAKRCIERRLQDVSVTRSFSEYGIPLRNKIYLAGEFTQSHKVNWHNQGRHHEMAELQSATGMSIDGALHIVEAPAVHTPTKVIEAAEMLVAIKKIELDERTPDEENVAALVDQGIMHIMSFRQMRVGNFGSKVATYFVRHENDWRAVHPTKLRRITAACGLFAVLGVGLGASEWEQYARNTYQREEFRNQKDYADKIGIKVEALTAQQKSVIQTRTQTEHPVVSSYVGLRQTEKDALLAAASALTSKLGGNADDSLAGESAMQVNFTGSSSVGNVPDPSNTTPLWHVAATDMSKTAGYWTSNIGYTLDLYGTWTSQYANRQESAVFFPLKPQNVNAASLIRVQGEVALDNESSVDGVPLLDGTHIVAADLDGTQVGAEKFSDGTYRIISDRHGTNAPRIQSGTLTYWLQFDKNGKAIHKPVPQYLTRYTRYHGIPRDQAYFPAVREEWEARTNITEKSSASARLEAETKYVKNTFTYKYKPLSDKLTNSMAKGQFNPIEFSEEQLKEGTANCNVAATLVALDNPWVNPTWGFMNDGDNELTVNEGHMWLTDKNGQRYDPTPIKMSPEPMPDVKTETIEALLGDKRFLGGLALLGLFGALRRPVQKVHARTVLSRMSGDQLHDVRRTVDTALYAKDFSVDSLPLTPRIDKQSQLNELSAPTYHEEATNRRMRQLATSMTGANKDAVIRARRILKYIRRSRRVRLPHAADDVYSVL